MDAYAVVLRDFLELVAQLWTRRIDAELGDFAAAFDAWLNTLFAHPTHDWRQRLNDFLADQAASGRTITPESRKELVAFLEGWIASPNIWADVTRNRPKRDANGAALQQLSGRQAAKKTPTSSRKRRGRFDRRDYRILSPAESFFRKKLAQAQRHLDELEQMLTTLGQEFDTASPGSPVLVDLDAIESLGSALIAPTFNIPDQTARASISSMIALRAAASQIRRVGRNMRDGSRRMIRME
ncbi:MAG: hypothetical protein DWQ37_00235 [Planctomycetota bacterium]|nr:MAG: hypothetical protein DWQ37_00235 [Planctomycetota bacterium]